MAVRTRSSNGPARASLWLGLLSVASVPAAIALAQELPQVDLLQAGFGIPFAAVFGIASVALARRARGHLQLTLGRAGGERVARAGRALGLLGLYVGTTAALAIGFYELLNAFAG